MAGGGSRSWCRRVPEPQKSGEWSGTPQHPAAMPPAPEPCSETWGEMQGGQATVFPKEPPSGTGRGRVQSPRLSDKQLQSLIPRRRCQASRPLSVLSPCQEFRPLPHLSLSGKPCVTDPESGPGSPVLPSLLPHHGQSWSWQCPPLGWLLVFYMVVSSLSLEVWEQHRTATKGGHSGESSSIRWGQVKWLWGPPGPSAILALKVPPASSVPGSWSAWVPPS